ncbi:hypothetical protein KKH23_11035 [Patescibacteria group bacterium]|nr:hypothetical protein [Patescibacteria group bacterium]
MAPLQDFVAAFFVLALYSFIYRDNLIYKFAEHTFLGIGVGIIVTMAVKNVRDQCLVPIIKGELILVPALLLGILMLFRVSKNYGWMSRFSLAVMFATTMATRVALTVQSQIVGQMLPAINAPILHTDPVTAISNIFGVTGLAAACTYFIFARKNVYPALKRPVDLFSKYGRYVVMAYLGASYANVMMGRISMFIERILFLCKTFGIA